MLVNSCFKGIAESATFDDAMAERVVSDTGIMSNRIVANGGTVMATAQGASQSALSATALDDHVNAYKKVAATTPYISLGVNTRYHPDARSEDWAPSFRRAGRVSSYTFCPLRRANLAAKRRVLASRNAANCFAVRS